MQPEPNRLFFALVPPAEVRERAAEAARSLQSTHGLGGRLINPRRYHITLFFLGDHVPDAAEQATLKAAQGIQSPPFSLCLNKAGSFRNRQIPVWLGSEHSPAELDHLAGALSKTMGQFTQERQPRFLPHLTILRNARGALPPVPIEAIQWAVEEYVLIRSVLHQQPARYEILGRWPLRGQPLPRQPEQQGLPF